MQRHRKAVRFFIQKGNRCQYANHIGGFEQEQQNTDYEQGGGEDHVFFHFGFLHFDRICAAVILGQRRSGWGGMRSAILFLPLWYDDVADVFLSGVIGFDGQIQPT